MSEKISIDLFNINILKEYTLGCVIAITNTVTDETKFGKVIDYYLDYDGYVTLKVNFIIKLGEDSSNYIVDLLDLNYTVTKI